MRQGWEGGAAEDEVRGERQQGRSAEYGQGQQGLRAGVWAGSGQGCERAASEDEGRGMGEEEKGNSSGSEHCIGLPQSAGPRGQRGKKERESENLACHPQCANNLHHGCALTCPLLSFTRALNP